MLRLLQLAACATVFALLAWAQLPRDKSALPLIGVYLDFDSAPETASVNAMEHAVESLLQPAGVRVAWRSMRENSGHEAFSGLAVMKFRGRCAARGPQTPDEFGTLGEVDALASTAVSGGHVLPYTEVECDQVRKALAYVRPGAGLLARQQALGLALGRVVAHELYHILGNTAAHTGEGLAKASELLRDLVSTGQLSFDQSAASRIGSELQPGK